MSTQCPFSKCNFQGEIEAKGVKYLVTEGNLTLGGEHTMQFIYNLLLIYVKFI